MTRADSPYLTSDEILTVKTGKRRSKYGVAPKADRTWCGVTYASRLEMRRLIDLHRCVELRELVAVIEQPRFRLGDPNAIYVADALVVPLGGGPWVEEIKGRETPKFKRDRKLWKRHGELPLHVITWVNGSWHCEIIPGGGPAWRTAAWHAASLKARRSDG